MFKRKKIYFTGSTQFVINTLSETSVEKEANYKKPWWAPFLGIFLISMSSVSFLLSSVFVKKLTYISPGQLSMIRNIGVLVGILPINIYSTKSIFGPKKHFWLLLLRSFLGATALYLNLMAFRYLPLAEASIIMATVPALVTIVARIYLKEPCGIVHVLSMLITALGLLISIRIPELLQNEFGTDFDREYIIGLASAFGCVLIVTFTFVSLRKMQDVHFSVIQFYFGVLGTMENSVLTALLSNFSWPRCDGWDAIQVMLIAVFGFVGHCFMTLAIQKEVASIVATSKAATDIMVSSFFQFLFFNSVPDAYTLGGGLLVLIAISSIGFYKWLLDQPEHSVHRKRLKCLGL